MWPCVRRERSGKGGEVECWAVLSGVLQQLERGSEGMRGNCGKIKMGMWQNGDVWRGACFACCAKGLRRFVLLGRPCGFLRKSFQTQDEDKAAIDRAK